MKRRILLLVALWFAIVCAATIHFYGDDSTQNAGIYWQIGTQFCGVEYRGTIGTFCNVT